MRCIPLLTLSLAAVSGLAVPVEWRVEDGGNGHFYDLVGNHADPSQRWTWATSKQMAEDLGGHLVTITSAAENQFLIDTFHVHHKLPTWIGLTDNEAYGGFESFGQADPTKDGWVWVTGEEITFNGWVGGQPDNTNDEDFALMGSSWGTDHLWNDGASHWDAAFFVEYEPLAVPESASFSMIIACAALLVARRFTGKG